MKTTPKERTEVLARLARVGVSDTDAAALRRIAMTLRSWFEYECGTGDGRITRSIERDGPDGDGKPFMRVQYAASSGWHDRRWPVPDREAGARKRLASIAARYPTLAFYVQGDCRGAALFVVTPEQLRGMPVDQGYSNGVAVY